MFLLCQFPRRNRNHLERNESTTAQSEGDSRKEEVATLQGLTEQQLLVEIRRFISETVRIRQAELFSRFSQDTRKFFDLQ